MQNKHRENMVFFLINFFQKYSKRAKSVIGIVYRRRTWRSFQKHTKNTLNKSASIKTYPFMFNLQYLLMKTQFIVLIMITALLGIVQAANDTNNNCLNYIKGACIECDDKTGLVFGWCYQKDANCELRSPGGNCVRCKKQFYLRQEGCYKKDIDCDKYPNISSISSCILCKNSTSLYGDLCLPRSHCTEVQDNICTKCESGYYIDDDGGCYIDSLQKNCKTLTPDGCTSCNDGNDMANGLCYKLGLNCKTNTNNICISCSQGYQLFKNRCYQKDRNCIGYDKNSICVSCGEGYYLNSGWCYIYLENCPSQYYIFNGWCFFAGPNCLITGPSGCNLCKLGYYLTQNTCYSLCSQHYSTGACKNCYTPYVLVGELCVSAVSTNPCLYFNRKRFCYKCPNGYSLYDGQCYTTIPYCQVYKIKVKLETQYCAVCQPGTSPKVNGSRCDYSPNLNQLSDGNSLSFGGGITAVNNNGSFVPCGQGCLACTSAGLTRVKCIAPQQRYYLTTEGALKCYNQTCLTCVPGTNTCKSCFDGYTLFTGKCVKCTDVNAVYCLPTNVSYSVFCSPTYTNSSMGECLPCAANCLKCDVNGPGSCDSSSCFFNYVQLTGTLNCTACMNSCTICDPNDIRKCLGCGPAQYNSRNVSCLACSYRCLQCNSSAGCSACELGYSLLNGICYQTLAYPCAIMSSVSQCSQCFQGYLLNGSKCILDVSTNRIYQQCSNGGCPSLYLISKIANCNASNSDGFCAFCLRGYYLTSYVNIPCSICPAGCRDCSSPYFCNLAADGYYLLNRSDGSNNGQVSKCRTPCKTCYQNQNYCLTCNEGYHISGSTCISNSTFLVRIVLGPSSSNTSIFNASDSNDIQLSKSIKSINRLINSLCQILKISLKYMDSNCMNVFRVTSLAIGSIIMTIQVDANMVLNAQNTKDSIYQGLTSQGLDGAKVMSTSIIDQIPSPSDSNPTSTSTFNLPLVLGLAIGLGVLGIIIVIVLLAIVKTRAKNADVKTPNDSTLKTEQALQGESNLKDPAITLTTKISFGPSPLVVQTVQTNIRISNNQTDGQDEIHEDAFGGIRRKPKTKNNTHLAPQRVKRIQTLPHI